MMTHFLFTKVGHQNPPSIYCCSRPCVCGSTCQKVWQLLHYSHQQWASPYCTKVLSCSGMPLIWTMHSSSWKSASFWARPPSSMPLMWRPRVLERKEKVHEWYLCWELCLCLSFDLTVHSERNSMEPRGCPKGPSHQGIPQAWSGCYSGNRDRHKRNYVPLCLVTAWTMLCGEWSSKRPQYFYHVVGWTAIPEFLLMILIQ